MSNTIEIVGNNAIARLADKEKFDAIVKEWKEADEKNWQDNWLSTFKIDGGYF